MAEYNWGNTSDIKAFQTAYGKGLARDGIAGSKTAAAMNTPYGRKIVDNLYNTGLNNYNSSTVQPVNIQSDSSLFNNGKSYTLAGGRSPTVVPQIQQSDDWYSNSTLAKMTPEEQQAFGAAGGYINDANQMVYGNQPTGLTGILQNKDLMTGLSAGASVLGTGFDIYDKMWGNSAKTAEAQQNLLNQQTRQNDQRMRDYKDFRQQVAKSGLSGAYNG